MQGTSHSVYLPPSLSQTLLNTRATTPAATRNKAPRCCLREKRQVWQRSLIQQSTMNTKLPRFHPHSSVAELELENFKTGILTRKQRNPQENQSPEAHPLRPSTAPSPSPCTRCTSMSPSSSDKIKKKIRSNLLHSMQRTKENVHGRANQPWFMHLESR